MLDEILKSARWVSAACKYEMFTVCAVAYCAYGAYAVIARLVEELLVGLAFRHWGDVLVGSFLVLYVSYCTYVCAIKNTEARGRNVDPKN